MKVERYEPGMATDWDEFVRASRNGTFLFERGYMDYHSDRFVDHSLLVREPEGEPLAVLPAHAQGQQVASHKGLSYGGMVTGARMKAPLFLRAFEIVLLYLRGAGFDSLYYKTIPSIYHQQPAEEDRYAMFLLGADLARRDVLSVIDRGEPLPYQGRRSRGIKKAQAAGITVQQETDFAEYWSLLAETLAERHDALPVHSLAEIQMLSERFPLSIRLFTARAQSSELLAGVVAYQSSQVVHTQYIASSLTGRSSGALDLLFDEIISDVSHDCPYFDFGSSHEEAGRVVNEGLIDQKEGFGARTVTQDHYRVDLTRIRSGILTGALR